jgi:D-alanyl-D-alanine carboxypeptidase
MIASTTKIMTALLAIESNQLDDIVTIDESILKAYGSCIYIELGEEIKLRDLVYGLMLRSGNDAALAIANHLGGLEYFVEKMNAKAKKLGMNNTYFINPHGLDEKTSNLSTAYDMAILTRAANSYDEYKKIVGTKKYIAKTNYKTYSWTNKNKLLRTYKYTTGGKTGYTEKAKRTLVTTATKNNLNLIVVTLNDGNDWGTHKTLYEYGFDNYKNYRVLNKRKFDINNDYYKDKLYISNDYYYPLMDDETDNMSLKIKLMKIRHPKDKEKVGVAEVYYKNKLVHEEAIYISKPEASSNSLWKRIIGWFTR